MSLHYNGANSYLFVNVAEIIKFKAKDSEIVATPLCLSNISKKSSVDKMKKIKCLGLLKNVFLQEWCLFGCNVLSVNLIKICFNE